jgi:methionyl-tRNA formyltransferase
VIEKTKKNLVIATKEGAISLVMVQPAGKPKMPIQDFLNGLGKTINIGDQFE